MCGLFKSNSRQEQEIIKKYLTGATCRGLAEKYSTSHGAISHLLKRNKIKVRNPTGKIFSKKQERRIAKEYLAGNNTPVLAVKFGVHLNTIDAALKRQKIKKRKASESRKLFFPEKEAKITRKYEAGEGTLALAKKYHINACTIREIVLRNGGHLRPIGDSLRGKKQSKKRIVAQKKRMTVLWQSPAFYKKMMAIFKSKEYKEKHRVLQNKNWKNPNFAKKTRKAHEKGCDVFWTPLAKKKKSDLNKKKWQDPEYAKRMFKAFAVKPNKKEKQLNTILQTHFPNEYLYTGDGKQGSFFGKIPDFINVNGRKSVIEMFGNWYHNPKYFPDRMGEKELRKHYAKFGHKALIIWERELKDEAKVIERIKDFHAQGAH